MLFSPICVADALQSYLWSATMLFDFTSGRRRSPEHFIGRRRPWMRLFFFRMSILPAGLKGGGEVGDVDERILPPHIRLRQPWHCQTPPIIPPVARIYRMAAQQCFVNRAGKRGWVRSSPFDGRWQEKKTFRAKVG
jgi:hypothetical protein